MRVGPGGGGVVEAGGGGVGEAVRGGAVLVRAVRQQG